MSAGSAGRASARTAGGRPGRPAPSPLVGPGAGPTSGCRRQAVVQVVPLRVNEVGRGLLSEKVPLKPMFVLAPGARVPL